jgi:hypothetical protein
MGGPSSISARWPIGLFPECSFYTERALRKLPAVWPLCIAAHNRTLAAPPYRSLLNSTFVLVPEGRQTASYRLDEVMAAGAIPVFLSEPFVPPFARQLRWEKMAVFVHTDQAKQLLDILASIPPATIEAMQRQVRHAWRSVMRPGAAVRAFYSALRRHVELTSPAVPVAASREPSWSS